MFLTRKGLRQGDPLPHLLFNRVFDVLTRLLLKASGNQLIRGLGQSIYPGGVISLEYATDTIMFATKDPVLAPNLTWILTCFEQVSGMSINFDKSVMIPINLDLCEINSLSQIFGLSHWQLPN